MEQNMSDPVNSSQGNHYSYQQDFIQSKALFKSSLEGYQAADFPQKKEAFKKPMDEAYQVLMDSASQLAGSHLESAKAQLSKDYAAFQENDSKENINQLYKDLNNLS